MDTSQVKAKPPSFANWRWDTLTTVMGYLEKAHASLTRVMQLGLFNGTQDPIAGLEACRTMQDELWWAQFWMILDVAVKFRGLRHWAAGCHCHEQARKRGEKVVCWMTGRRLSTAWEALQGFLANCSSRFGKPLDVNYVTEMEVDLEKFQLVETRGWLWKLT